MKLIELIVKEVKRVTDKIRKNTIAKVSLSVTILIIVRKLVLLKKSSPQQAKIIMETVSSFYDKLSKNDIKKVTILGDYIRYRDLSYQAYQAILPKNLHSLLEDKLRYHICYSENLTFNMVLPTVQILQVSSL